MANFTRRRLVQDLKKLQNDPQNGLTAQPTDKNIMLWDALIYGPEDTIWEGSIFRLSLEFTEDYPNKAPIVRFQTPIFHPNVYLNGDICLDILQKEWTQLYDVSAILTSIRSLLLDPNPDSPANNEAAKLYTQDLKAYQKRIKQIVEESWKYQFQ